MQTKTIAKDHQEDFIASFWFMLLEMQNTAHNDNDIVGKHFVEGFFRQWDTVTGDNKKPVWIK